MTDKPNKYRVNIGESGNTLSGYPLQLLRQRGFTVFYPPNTAVDYQGLDVWALHPNGTRLIASNCLGLLGLLSILDHLGDEWYTAPKIDLWKLPKRDPFPVDLAPEVLAELPDDEVEENIDAFMLLCRLKRPEIPRPDSKTALVDAAKLYLQTAEESRIQAED